MNLLIFIGIAMRPGFPGNKEIDLARFVDFYVTEQMRYHGDQVSDFPKNCLFIEKVSILHFLPFS